MSSSIVLELQHLATEPDSDVAPLLRKALVIATKLKREDFRSWASSELNGYDGRDVPEYRRLRASISLKNPYHGLIPVHFPSEEMFDLFTRINVQDPISNLIAILDGHSPNKTNPIFPLSPKQEAFLLQNQDGLSLPPIRTVPINQIEGIIEAVRTAILEWTLKLEEEGILGEGMTFTPAEKNKAMQSADIRIENFQGILGNVTQSSVTQNLTLKIEKEDFDSLSRYLSSIGVDEKEIGELRQSLEQDGKPTAKGFGSRVSQWIGKMVTKAADGGWQVGIGAAANLLSDAVKAYWGIL
ncbi:hypothetical protein M2447_002645 [Ereboglobus sp. PH5-10]|uniref:AbiTii domain-containing protein n=1 Tax=Ereboglobus sp. PH5-10 TaxID=2940629 RepID=UPI002405173F|nr:hypothetical protein [Ereboglobus sp. PH5-10]MDF9828521.1 hypothetical protein [Ereboglobus sp. PH5-10]